MASRIRAIYPGISPEIALLHLQRGQGTDGGSSGGPDQAEWLEQWLRAEGLCVPKSAFAGGFVGAGAEHETYVDVIGGCAVKLTHDGRFGHCLRREGAVSTPMDYLRRLAWHNELFGDDIMLHGFLGNSAGLRLVSSQPWIISNPARLTPTQDEIDAFLADFGFTRSRRYLDGFIYFNPEAGLVIGDAQPTNLLLDETGTIRPIDLVIAEPEEDFRLKLTSAGC